jgi:hypothetical protein
MNLVARKLILLFLLLVFAKGGTKINERGINTHNTLKPNKISWGNIFQKKAGLLELSGSNNTKLTITNLDHYGVPS